MVILKRAPGGWWLLAGCLLVVDGMLLVANVLHLRVNEPWEPRHRVLSGWRWAGDADGSHIEVSGYLQLAATVVVLVMLAVRRRAAVYGAWALVVAAIVADDALRLHERWGAALADVFSLPVVGGLRPQDLGEVGVWLIASVVIGAVVVGAHRRSQRRDRRRSWVLLLLVGALALFAVGVDMIHGVLAGTDGVAGIALAFVETAGELVVMSALLVAVTLMVLRDGNSPAEGVETADRRASTW